MQGMMIQDFQSVPKSGGKSVVTGRQESSEQSFGEVLGTETEVLATETGVLATETEVLGTETGKIE